MCKVTGRDQAAITVLLFDVSHEFIIFGVSLVGQCVNCVTQAQTLLKVLIEKSSLNFRNFL